MSTIDFRHLANSGVRELTPYQPGKPTEELERELGITSSIKLASNENPLGASPVAIAAGQLALANMHIYPDGGCFELKHTLADFLNVKPEQLTIGNGSENVLELIVKSYLHPGNSAVISQFAFLTIPILIQSYAAITKVVPAQNWGHDIPNMIKAIDDSTRIIFIVNPNNPTGTYTSIAEFELLMKSVPANVLVVIDEAYSEYIHQDDYPIVQSYLDKYPNLIITRTFSKVYGLAGLRLGYAISSPEVADILNRARLPFNVNSVAAKVACTAIKDQSHVDKSIALNNEGMKQVTHALQQRGISYIPSIGNFVTIDVSDAKAIYQKLLLEGVIVRPLQAYGMPRHIRVTIGTHQQNERFIAALDNVL